jgi:RNA polymerase sigma-70 factor (ECF subfamily)
MNTESGAIVAASDDATLIRLVRGGDREAFGRLVERYMRRAYFAALALVGSRDDALDLSQEAFIRAFRARRTIDPDRPFYAWLYQILRRLCFNFRRDRATRSRALASGAWLIAEEAAARGEADPARALELQTLRDRLTDAIDRLPDREREVFVLKEFEGLKYRDIAELVGVPLGTVMSRLYAARRRLADALEGNR